MVYDDVISRCMHPRVFVYFQACHVLLRFDTGDFDGQRETKECAAHVTRYIVQQIASDIGVKVTMHMRDGK